MAESGATRRNEQMTNIYDTNVGTSIVQVKQEAFRCKVNHAYRIDLKLKSPNREMLNLKFERFI